MSPSRARALYLGTAVLATIALLLGLWDLLVEADGGNYLWQVGFPLMLLVWSLVMARKAGVEEGVRDRSTLT